VFDLRSPVSNSSGQGGSVRVARCFIGDGPNDLSDGSVRAVVEPMPEGSDLCNILLDSGADASIFPSSMSSFRVDSETPANRLQDAQGNSIPVDGMKDIEIRLMDQYGRSVLLKETVAVSSQITQPILCFGHLLENGWGVNGREQTLVHGSGVSVPIEMQNKPMSIRGWIRFLCEEPHALRPMVIRAVRADVLPDLSDMRIGWNLNAEGIGRGKHYGSCFQDPTVFCLTMAGDKFRTTLIQDGGAWFVLELCEPMSTLIDCSAEFFGYVGDKFIITIITSSERPPQAMAKGFTMLADGEEPLAMGPVALHEHAEAAHVPIAPEDDDNIAGIDVDDIQFDEQGADIPQGQVVIAPERGDHLLANGVEIFSNTALATMRGVC
jgi:hypothetical protein